MTRLVLLLAAASATFAQSAVPFDGLSHVVFRVSDAAQARPFYETVLGFPAANGTDFRVNAGQFVRLEPGLPPGEIVRVRAVGFRVTGIAAAAQALESRGLKLERAGGVLTLHDPEGNTLLFTTERVGGSDGARRISPRLRHAGVPVRRDRLDATLKFYTETLGFTEIWRGGPEGQPFAWINLRLPDSTGDYIELMIHEGQTDRGRWGSMLHICLEVDSVPGAHQELLTRGVPDSPRHAPRVGRNGRRQLNLFDPDGSRTELMEPRQAHELLR